MRHSIGFFMQFCCLVFLPLLILFQINFKLPLVLMPVSLLITIAIFLIGQQLRES